MPRYLVERSLATGPDELLADVPVAAIVEANADAGVVWLHSYVDEECRRILCLYEATGPEAIRRAARRAGLPIDVIHQVSVFDPAAFLPRRKSENGNR